ncbi:MAG TPA: DUF3298 domain-containing protein [Candidatus Paceibacterota bacterium]
MNNKHRALWAVGGLLAIFIALLIWYMATHPAPTAVAPGDVATTTPPFVDTPQHIVDNGTYHEIDVAYPGVTPLFTSAGAEADAAAVSAMRNFSQNTVNAFRESAEMEMPGLGEFARDRKYTMDVEYKLFESPKTISYVYMIYQDTLGAHPNTYYRTFSYDRSSGEDLHLEDLFVPGAPYLERLSERTRAELPIIMGRMAQMSPSEVDMDYINSGTMPIGDSFGNFKIEGANLVMIFPPYQVGPYVYGVLEVPISLSSLRDILEPGYLPN